MGTLTQLVDVGQHIGSGLAHAPVSLGTGEVSLGQTDEGNVGVGHIGVVVVGGAVGVLVGPLDDGQAVFDLSHLLGFNLAVVAAEEEGAVVAGSLCNGVAFRRHGHVGAVVEEEVNHLRTGTDAGPGVVGAVEVGAVGGVAAADDGPGAAVGFHFLTVLTYGQDDFLHGLGVAVVVANEELLVTAELALCLLAQAVAARDGAGGPVGSLLPARGAGVDLGVEVEAREHDVEGGLVDLAKACAGRVSLGELLLDGLVFALDVGKEVGAHFLHGFLGVEGFLERSAAEEVEEVLVVHGAEEAHLGATRLRGFVGQALVEVEEVVALRDVVAQTVVEHTGEDVLIVPREVEELCLAGVVLPSPEALVGGELLLLPHAAEEGVLTGVVGDVGLVGGSLLSRQGEEGVDFGVVPVLFGRTLGLRVDGRLVEVVSAGCEAQS